LRQWFLQFQFKKKL